MRYRTLKLGVVAATVVATVLPLALFVAGPAVADYAPTESDVVGVGSDTLQYMLDFMADGDAYAGTLAITLLGNKYKVVNFDATADANARLAYGVDGGQAAQTTCTPGTGSTSGTGNADRDQHRCSLRAQPDHSAARRPSARAAAQRLGCRVQGPRPRHPGRRQRRTGATGAKPEVINYARASCHADDFGA